MGLTMAAPVPAASQQQNSPKAHPKLKSTIFCYKCPAKHACHDDHINSILSSITTSPLFKDDPTHCFVCHHGPDSHFRSIDENIVRKLFNYAKAMSNSAGIYQRLAYLGDGNKNIVNVLLIDNFPLYTSHVWTQVLWQSNQVSKPQQKVDFI